MYIPHFIITDRENRSTKAKTGAGSVVTILGFITFIQYAEKYQHIILTPRGKTDMLGTHWKLLLKDKYNKTMTWQQQLYLSWFVAEHSRMTAVNINNKRQREITAGDAVLILQTVSAETVSDIRNKYVLTSQYIFF